LLHQVGLTNHFTDVTLSCTTLQRYHSTNNSQQRKCRGYS